MRRPTTPTTTCRVTSPRIPPPPVVAVLEPRCEIRAHLFDDLRQLWRLSASVPLRTPRILSAAYTPESGTRESRGIPSAHGRCAGNRGRSSCRSRAGSNRSGRRTHGRSRRSREAHSRRGRRRRHGATVPLPTSFVVKKGSKRWALTSETEERIARYLAPRRRRGTIGSWASCGCASKFLSFGCGEAVRSAAGRMS
jgi:hypothetical protein